MAILNIRNFWATLAQSEERVTLHLQVSREFKAHIWVYRLLKMNK